MLQSPNHVPPLMRRANGLVTSNTETNRFLIPTLRAHFHLMGLFNSGRWLVWRIRCKHRLHVTFRFAVVRFTALRSLHKTGDRDVTI